MCRKDLKLGMMHRKQEGQEVHLPILVESLTRSFTPSPDFVLGSYRVPTHHAVGLLVFLGFPPYPDKHDQ